MIDFSKALDQIQAMIEGFITVLPNMGIAIIIFAAFYMGAGLAKQWAATLSRKYGHNDNLAIVLGRLAYWVVIFMGGLVSVVIIFPNISPLQFFEFLGLGSVALGFAFRDILQNFLAGILLLITEPFQIGDQIIIEDFEGTVEMIETRATTLRTYDGRRVVIPNTQMFTTPVVVNTAFEKRRIEYDIGIGYGESIAEAKQVILDALMADDAILKVPPPQVIVVELGEFSIHLRVRWWIEPALRAEAVDTRDEVLDVIQAALSAHDIAMPYPTQEVLVQGKD
jgi:small-conductance mechanosensitive channel